MREVTYLSPSSLALWEKDQEAFFERYVSDPPVPRPLQANYAAIGSAFDAYVKAELIEACTGDKCFEKLFETQVESEWRDWARVAGKYALDCYKVSGAYNVLLSALLASDTPPRFEFRLNKVIDGIPLVGCPDLKYSIQRLPTILDWKVNGFCSKWGASPYKFYSIVRDGWVDNPSKNSGQAYPGYVEINVGGTSIGNHYLEQTNKDWADQLSMYGWLMDLPVGSEDAIVQIEQLVCKPGTPWPRIRVASHRCRISAAWQTQLWQRIKTCWEMLPTAFADGRGEMLEATARARAAADTDIERWIFETGSKKTSYTERAR